MDNAYQKLECCYESICNKIPIKNITMINFVANKDIGFVKFGQSLTQFFEHTQAKKKTKFNLNFTGKCHFRV